MARTAYHPPPQLRDDRVDLVTISAMAQTFDHISREDGRDWPAVRFVEWLECEWRASLAADRPVERLRRQPMRQPRAVDGGGRSVQSLDDNEHVS
jgi:hypothetical protein